MRTITDKYVTWYGYKAKITIKETPPQWRTINKKYYLFFPYMQFIQFNNIDESYQSTLRIKSSLNPYPNNPITLPDYLTPSCLGHYWQVSNHTIEQNIERYWNTEFLLNGMERLYIDNLLKLTELYKQDVWKKYGDVQPHHDLIGKILEINH